MNKNKYQEGRACWWFEKKVIYFSYFKAISKGKGWEIQIMEI